MPRLRAISNVSGKMLAPARVVQHTQNRSSFRHPGFDNENEVRNGAGIDALNGSSSRIRSAS